jgi:hypothetical protein
VGIITLRTILSLGAIRKANHNCARRVLIDENWRWRRRRAAGSFATTGWAVAGKRSPVAWVVSSLLFS